MEVKKEINSYLARAGWTLTAVAQELTLRHNKNVTVQNLSNKLTKGTIRYSEVLEIADIIGYSLTWIQKETND